MKIRSTVQLVGFCIALLFTMYAHQAQAQKKLWEIDLQESLYKVSWIEQSNDGIIIASGDKGLLGLDNNTGDIKWQHAELKAIDRQTFRLIDPLPIFLVETNLSGLPGQSRSLLINSTNGEILFDSKNEGLKIGLYHVLPQINSIVFEATQEKSNKLLLFDYTDGKIKWSIDLGESTGLIKKIFKNQDGFLSTPPSLMHDEQMLIGEKKKITVIDYAKGSIVWSKVLPKELKALIYSSPDQKIYAGIKEKLQIFDSKNGQDVTGSKLKLGGELRDVFINSKKQVVILDEKGFNILDPSSQRFLWKNFAQVDGLYDVIEINDAYYGIGSEEKSSVIMKVLLGKKIWKEKLAGFAYQVLPIETGLFYLSSEKSNILRYESGAKIWKRDVKFKAIPSAAIDETSGQKEVAFYEGGSLYSFDLKSGNLHVLHEAIDFKKTKNSIFNLEIRPQGYYIYSQQHMAFVDRKGSLAYTQNFDPVTSSTALMGLGQFGLTYVAGIDLDIQGSLSTISELQALSNGSYYSAGDQTEGQIDFSSFNANIGNNTLYAFTKKRFYNATLTQDSQLIVCNMKEEGNQIRCLDKESGKLLFKIPLEDKTPSYVTDQIDNRVFLNQKNRLVSAYQF